MTATGTRRRSPSQPSSSATPSSQPSSRRRSSRTAARSVPQESTGPRLRLVPARRVSGRVVLVWGTALFFLVLAGSVAIQAQRIEAQHRLDRIDAELITAGEEQRQLRAEVAVAESPAQVMQAARDIGMVDPGPVVPLSPRPAAPPADPPAALADPAASAIDPGLPLDPAPSAVAIPER